MVNVGVIGLGMMGLTHLDVYSKATNARVVAIADLDADRRSGRVRASGNIDGQAQGLFDYAAVKQYAEGMDLIADPNVHAVDICLITPLHYQYAIAAMKAGKHVMVEKPLARTAADAHALADAADRYDGVAMCAMCMRFWPAWSWLKETIATQTYGKVLSAQFRRVATHPGGAFYSSGQATGGAVLDLHIHDTDFVQYCFGTPEGVATVGYVGVTDQLDHVVTQYKYKDVPLVVAEGGWSMATGFGFRMQYTVNFEQATASFDLDSSPQLKLWQAGKGLREIEVVDGAGYEHEVAYFLDCIGKKEKPVRVTLRDAARSIEIVEAEIRSARSGRIETLEAMVI